MFKSTDILSRLPLLFCIGFVVVLIIYLPKNVLKRFERKTPVSADPDDGPTGTWLTGGVIYPASFLAATSSKPSTKEPASYTPYVQDYIVPIRRPKVKPFPLV